MGEWSLLLCPGDVLGDVAEVHREGEQDGDDEDDERRAAGTRG
ncbi:hypothetical protein VB779_15560 [Haloarculaceae archaeon H-GB11]|nr:hypothetical protein [Haloarculaceae archaeon H-GB1-1]MEA5388312.1 hypothetical protein [Haloarculaceae archaeon H-GB11]